MPNPIPCPFCAGTDIQHITFPTVSGKSTYFRCSDCTATGPDGDSRESALLQWNQREVPSDADSEQ